MHNSFTLWFFSEVAAELAFHDNRSPKVIVLAKFWFSEKSLRVDANLGIVQTFLDPRIIASEQFFFTWKAESITKLVRRLIEYFCTSRKCLDELYNEQIRSYFLEKT